MYLLVYIVKFTFVFAQVVYMYIPSSMLLLVNDQSIVVPSEKDAKSFFLSHSVFLAGGRCSHHFHSFFAC